MKKRKKGMPTTFFPFTACLMAGFVLPATAVPSNASSQPTGTEKHWPVGNQRQTVADILATARKVFKVDFVYKAGILPDAAVQFEISRYKKLEPLLDDLLKPFSLDYRKVYDNTYAIVEGAKYGPKTPSQQVTEGGEPLSLNTVNSATATTQVSDTLRKRAITGKVLDEKDGQPVIGATVLVKNTRNGAKTDAQGQYHIDVNSNDAVLVFSAIGFTSQEIVVKDQRNINIQLAVSNEALSEVVVVGYGTRRRKDLTSSISSVTSKEISATPVADAGQALQGRVSGVTIVQNSGVPGGGGGTQIRIRGISSLTSTNNPLIVLDGFPLPDQDADNILNSFSPNDIASIDVLKDAAASAIYGTRGSNGVIMITTKRGKAGRANINVDVYRGIQEAWRLPKMLNAKDYAVINTEARKASGLDPIPKLVDPNAIEQKYGQGTNWMKEIFRQAPMQSVNLSVTGGSEKAQYALSGGYFKQNGIIRNSDFERFNLRFNGDLQASKRLKVGNSLSMSRTVEHGIESTDPFNSTILLALTAPPTVRPKNPDGSYAGGLSEDGFGEPDAVYNLEVPQRAYTRYRITGNVFAEYLITDHLKFKANVGADLLHAARKDFYPATPATGGAPITITRLNEASNLDPSWLSELTLDYNRTFGQHRVGVLLGYTAQDNQFSSLNASRNGYGRIDMPVLDNGAVTLKDLSQIDNFSSFGRNRLISYIGRVNYDFKDRYLFSASLRRDGSSNFAANHRFTNMPSFSAAWRVTQESFMKQQRLFDDLKLRVSYGFNGNQNIPTFTYLTKINTGLQYVFGNSSGSGGATGGAAPTTYANPLVKWEMNEQLNIGVDLSILDGRISGSVDWYVRKSKDLLLLVSPAGVSGYIDPTATNTGLMQNKGVDVALNTVNVDGKDFKWSSQIVVAAYRNKVTSLGKSSPINQEFQRITGGAKRISAGMPAFYFYGFKTDGIFQTWDEVNKHAVQVPGTDPTTSTAPGDIRFVDINGDGVINDEDRTNLGNQYPTFTYGFTNNFSFKGFDLSIFLQGSQGNKVLNFTRWYTEGGVSNGNYSQKVLERWTGPGTSNSMPRMIQNDPNQNQRVSDRFVENGSYLRIKNVRLSYRLPQRWTSYAHLQKIQLYTSVQNLATFTKYSGIDPEVGDGVDYGYYPQARTFQFGINVDF
ncbi:TonB-dependent receptor [Chitinophaga pendula]|uniref:SusC/RagA family TonB-linked outer membrane protein n=1 Tax=Chitinophaga TaxID=79328 RepID=UPI000BAFDEC3|nr:MULTISPECIES: TonB-dependent receptor [Chitinophaga]ASZ10172.1 SusC/RagA family TonB-linked outer membrane protein [Chitinophaga sp. MD30]UCJ06873.1 TonB-dependent receptor [Chitinophaga pendula]